MIEVWRRLSVFQGWLLVWLAAAWLTGILVAAWLSWPPLFALVGAAGTLLGALFQWHDKRWRIGLLLLGVTLLGAWRFALGAPSYDPLALSHYLGPLQVELQGVVSDEPKLTGHSRQLQIAVSARSTDGGTTWHEVHGQLAVQVLGTTIEDPFGANYGDSLLLRGRLQSPQPHSSPEILANMTFPSVKVVSSGGNLLLAGLYHLRVEMAARLTQTLPQPEAALLIAILLSLRTPALQPLSLLFNLTGLAHLVAPSGFKITICSGLITRSCQRFFEKPGIEQAYLLPAEHRKRSRRRWLTTVVVIFGILIYTLLSGAGPAAIRAGLMGALLVLAPRFERSYNFYTAMACAALLMSLADPFVLWDAGFQLSFLGTLGIVLMTPFFQHPFRWLERFPAGSIGSELVAVTLAAQVATLPISALTFQQLSFVAPLANILTVPLLEIFLVLGLITCVAGLLFLPLGLLCGWIVWVPLRYLVAVIPWCASLPGAYLSTGTVPLSASLGWGYYALLGLCIGLLLYQRSLKQQQLLASASAPAMLTPPHPHLPRRPLLLAQLGAALLIVLSTGTAIALGSHAQANFSLTLLNLGPPEQAALGTALLLQTPDHRTALIDGGPDAALLASTLDSLLPFWQRSLDMLLLTTPRGNHLTGLQDVSNRYQVALTLDAGMLHPSAAYALWRQSLVDHGQHYQRLHQGNSLMLGPQLALQVFWPPPLLHKSADETRDNALVLKISTPGLQLLLLGDAALSRYALAGLLANIAPMDLQSDIVMITDDSSKSLPASLDQLLRLARPSLLLITPATPKRSRLNQAKSSTNPNPLTRFLTINNEQVIKVTTAGTLSIYSQGFRWGIQP